MSVAVSTLWVFTVAVLSTAVSTLLVFSTAVATLWVFSTAVSPLRVFSAAVSDHCHCRGCSVQQCQTTVTTVCVQCSRVRPLSLPCVFSAAVSDHCHCRWCSVQPCQTAVRGSLLALWVSRIVVRLVSVWIGRCRWQLSDGCPR